MPRTAVRTPWKPVWLGVALAMMVVVDSAHSAFNTTVPVSEQSASSIAVSLFPVAVALERANLFLTNPQVLFLDRQRIAIRASFQAYDHRPDEGVALSETGLAMLSGRVAYDRAARQVLLHDARVERLAFDRDNDTTRHFSRLLLRAWSQEVPNPIRTGLPPHPYLTPIKDNIDNILYDGTHISLVLVYK